MDGALAAEGKGVSLCPEEKTLAGSGFCLGGDARGASLAEGKFDELTTLGSVARPEEIAANYLWLNPVLQLGPVTSAEIQARRAKSAAAKSAKQLKADSGDEGGGGMMLRSTPSVPESPCGANGLCLSIQQVEQFVVLTLHNTQPGTNYIVESKLELPGTSWSFEQQLVGLDGTNWTQTVFPMTGEARFFRARTADGAEPRLHITAVREPVLPEPYVQVVGYSETPLASVRCRVVVDGTNFSTARGYVTESGVVERDGTFWVDVTLSSPTNSFVIIATDAGGLASTNAVTVKSSEWAFIITGIGPEDDLYNATVTVGGTLETSGYTDVLINGVAATVTGEDWIAEHVPVNRGGVALFRGRASGPHLPPLQTELTLDKPTRAFFSQIDRDQFHAQDWSPCDFQADGGPTSIDSTQRLHWIKYQGGQNIIQTYQLVTCESNHPTTNNTLFTEWWNALSRYTNSAGASNWTETTLPRAFVEHGHVEATKAQTTPVGTKLAHYSLQSEGQMHVQSGGKSIAHRTGLVRFAGGGDEYRVLADPNNASTNDATLWNWSFDPQYAASGYVTNLAVNTIAVMGKSLHTNGLLFDRLPAGAEVDCTPAAAADYYHITLAAAEASPKLYNDANNDNSITVVDSHAADDFLKDAPPSGINPGRIIFVNNGDADRDGVPNFADGYGLFGTNESPDSGGLFTPLLIRLPAAIDPGNALLRFRYSSSNPLLVSAQTNGEDVTYTPAGGQIRLWTANGTSARSGAPVGLFGNFIEAGTSYDASALGLVANPGYPVTATIYVEALIPSQKAGDALVTLEVDPDGTNGPAGFIGMDQVRFTALDIQLVEATGATATVTAAAFKESLPSPVISGTASIENIRTADDGSRLLADITVGGTVTSALCDITPGTNGIITSVFIYMNGLGDPNETNGVPVTVSKNNGTASLTAPYAFSGSFSRTYYGVEVDVGDNVVRVTATDPIVGGTGYAELTTAITATDLLPNQNSGVSLLYTDVRATLDFGTNIHTLADLRTNTVRLAYEVLSLNQHFTNNLLIVTNALTNGLVLLKSSQAWVSITDTNTLADYLRGDVRGSHLLAAVSVPVYGALSTLFDLHETGDATSVFTSDYYGLAMGFTNTLSASVTNGITARLVRLGGSSVSNLLVETGVNTLLFETSDHSFQIQLSTSPPFASTNVDLADATVTSATLGATNLLLNTYETATNSFVLATIDDVVPADDDLGAYFGSSFSASSFSQTANSDGGQLHLHYGQFQGPADVITYAASRPNSGLVVGPDGKYYLANSLNAPALMLGLAADPSGAISTNCTGTVLGGFTKGVAKGVKGFVWDGWYALGELVSDRVVQPVEDLAFDLYSVSTGSLNKNDFLESWTQRLKKQFPWAESLGAYVLNELPNQSGDFAATPFRSIDDGFASLSQNLKSLGDQAQQAFLVGSALLKRLWDDLQNACPQRRSEVIGRVTFEVVTFVAILSKAAQVARVAEAAKVTETELLNKLAAESTVPEARQAAAALLEELATLGRFKAVTVSEAQQLLIKNGVRAADAQKYVVSFTGPISMRVVEPGETFFRYTSDAGSKGRFLTKSQFATPAEAVDALHLHPFPNRATLRQTVTANRRTVVLEGEIAHGNPPGTRQTLIVKKSFSYTAGQPY